MYKIHEQTFQEIRGGNIDCVFYSSSCVHDKYLSMSNVYSLRRGIDNSLTIFKIYTCLIKQQFFEFFRQSSLVDLIENSNEKRFHYYNISLRQNYYTMCPIKEHTFLYHQARFLIIPIFYRHSFTINQNQLNSNKKIR